jgi:hypothetical protein
VVEILVDNVVGTLVAGVEVAERVVKVVGGGGAGEDELCKVRGIDDVDGLVFGNVTGTVVDVLGGGGGGGGGSEDEFGEVAGMDVVVVGGGGGGAACVLDVVTRTEVDVAGIVLEVVTGTVVDVAGDFDVVPVPVLS